MTQYTSMGAVRVAYEEGRSADNFRHWNPPEGSQLYWQVMLPPGASDDMWPTFNVVHSKEGEDTVWYKGVQNDNTFAVSSQNGGPGGHSIFVATQSPIFKDPPQWYTVACYWYMP